VIPYQFNQKKGLTICAKGDTAQNQSGADHAADQRALAGESSIGKWHTSRSLSATRLTTAYLGLLVGRSVLGRCGNLTPGKSRYRACGLSVHKRGSGKLPRRRVGVTERPNRTCGNPDFTVHRCAADTLILDECSRTRKLCWACGLCSQASGRVVGLPENGP
jgi:hypothetical protein